LAASLLPVSVSAQSAKEIRGASPYNTIDNEPAPRIIVDPPLAEPLGRRLVEIQYRVENVHIAPVFGAGATSVSPRLGHLHITLDDLPWHWVGSSYEDNTIAVVGLPAGQHKIMVEAFTACAECKQTITFTVPDTGSHAH
jgi:hypothetical protein